MKRTSRVIVGTLAGTAQTLIAIALQIVLMPLILRTVGQEVVGVYAILLQILGYLALLDLGISTALVRSMSQSLDRPARFQTLMTGGFYLLMLTGLIYAAACAAMAVAIADLFKLGSPLAEQARASMLLLAFWGLLRFPVSIYSTALLAIQDLSIAPVLGAAANALRMIVSVWSVIEGHGLMGLVAASVLSEALLSGALLLRFTRLRHGVGIPLAGIDADVLKELFGFGFKALWGSLASRIILFTDNIMVGYLRGPAAASIYYNTQTPVSIPTSLVFRLTDNASPGINELWAAREWPKLRDIFLRLQRLTLLVVSPIVIGGWFYLPTVIAIWVGPQQFAGQAMTGWLVIFSLLITASHVPLIFLYASGEIGRFAWVTSLEAVANLSLSFLLGNFIGLQGVALATTLAHIPTAVYLQRDVHRRLHVPLGIWLQQTAWPVIATALPVSFATAAFMLMPPPATWLTLGEHALILGPIYAVCAFGLGLTGEERHIIIDRIAGVRKRV